ncbi:uncharacterized protein J7T54_005865 [Emericellopsis cladophorae]|uniref:Uncharacterized protein n=1 Tax=Emericellopsis cladophorae TaxID=2686198 RepID=A0A9Q0BB02_9HYPO|nr:uncharacterized protein J7T54_005865 [Emericellopsis cladophorae]KAI6778762.1 hypothetical protein J7T54_005865 [Emericellopsis cladophorae]
MTALSRFLEAMPDSVGLKTAFGGHHETQRMEAIRPNLQKVRQAWQSNDEYRLMMERVRRHIQPSLLPDETQQIFLRLLGGFRDYGDIDNQRPEKPPVEQLDAIELYTSVAGFNSLYSLICKAMRNEKAADEVLESAIVMVELLTIDLYNLRLTNIGHPRYANFEGVTYRGLKVTEDEMSEYKAIMDREDRSRRNFSTPLGLLSSSTDKKVMDEFSKQESQQQGASSGDRRRIRVHLTIHIHGMDPRLLQEYQARYPDSVVTSICAMPVAHVSSEGEKEILLRGPFFHLIATKELENEGETYYELLVVMMNTNRDHGLEHASNQGCKERQRRCFLHAVSASKFDVCAGLADKLGRLDDAVEYRNLRQKALDELRCTHNIDVELDDSLAKTRSKDMATWFGGALKSSYPHHYASRRVAWQEAIRREDWVEAEKIIETEYDFQKREWFNVGNLTDQGENLLYDHLTFLHILAIKSCPEVDDTEQREETVRSFDKDRHTAFQLAKMHANEGLISRLQPRIIHAIQPEVLDGLEKRLHHLMEDRLGEFLDKHAFHMPQLSVLTEMEIPDLWIPIPLMYGKNQYESRLSPMQSSKHYQKIVHEQAKVLAAGDDIAAIENGLKCFHNLKK